jgi:hypothetical protein
MPSSRIQADERVKAVSFSNETISVDLMDGRTIIAPLMWFPRLMNATPQQLLNWTICGGGYGIHWEEIDEDISTEGLLMGASAPQKVKKIA